MSLSLQRGNPESEPSGPGEPNIPPLLAVALALSLSATTGLLTDWETAVTVFASVLALCSRSRPPE